MKLFSVKSLTFMLACSLLHHQAHADVCHVTSNGVPTNTANSWGQATTLQEALANGNGKNCTEIWLKEGVYKPVVPADTLNITDAERQVSFAINRPLKIYGGFKGTETQFSQRGSVDPAQTILSGDIDNDDNTTAGVTLISEDQAGKNSFHVIVIGGTDPTTGNAAYTTNNTVLEGFSITGGLANGSDTTLEDQGGGLLCNGVGTGNECSPTLDNIKLQGNKASYGGGAMYLGKDGGKSSPQTTNTEFSGNAANHGGAIYHYAGNGESNPSIQNAIFKNNLAIDDGGAIQNFASSNATHSGTLTLTVTATAFEENSAKGGGALSYYAESTANIDGVITQSNFIKNSASDNGGAVRIRSRGSSKINPTFASTTFTENKAKNSGGAVNIWGDDGVANSSFTNTTFIKNQATTYLGGAIRVNCKYDDAKCNLIIAQSKFIENQADDGGGAISIHSTLSASCQPRITNSSFISNTATGNWRAEGGAIAMYQYDSGVISAVTSHSTFASNSASSAGKSIYPGNANAQIRNSIIWGSEDGQVSNTPRIVRSVVSSGCPQDGVCTDVITDDPKLVAIQNSDGINHAMRLGTGSSAIDKINTLDCKDALGNALAEDQLGNARPQGTACDMGALEMAQFNLTITTTGQGKVSAAADSQAIGSNQIANCSGTCAANYPENGNVNLIAAPTNGWKVKSWSGNCTVDNTNTNKASVVVDANKTCTVTFVEGVDTNPAPDEVFKDGFE